jgi:DNA polymerase I-like protein with 3'-5' exonuclease and polymerase domains
MSTVIPCTDLFFLTYIDKFCSSDVPKILQNGKYDIAYLARFGVTLEYYLWDTATMMHCWYSELPKDLASLFAFFMRDSMYWKDMAETASLSEYYEYNARDTYGTAIVFLAWMLEAPEWAKQNYLMEFPLLFACHLCEMTGIKRDAEKLEIARKEYDTKIAEQTAQLCIEVGTPNFNPNSPKQVGQLLRALGCGDLPSTDEKNLAKAAFRHPLNDRIVNLILDIRGDRKLVSTYLDGSKDFVGRTLYALNPHNTDSGRLASKEHHFWCGSNIQNQPRGHSVKQTYVADDGFLLGEVDLEQAESRDTAYITGDTKLIANVSCGKDFHSLNASSFFGTAYDKIYSDELHKTLDKPLRDLAKRVNHGANYNMGPDVLVDTMGLKLIYKAASLLGLPRFWNPRQIATELLGRFATTYTVVRHDYQEWIKHTVETSKLLVGATGWTRYCFGSPSKSKQDLNAYIAHCPQSLNAMVLNKAFMKIFYEIALHPEHRNNFRLLCQIHDSVLFQYREGHEYLADKVREFMEIPVVIKDIKGITREFTVPAAVKIGGKTWAELG